jgi:hypothetical protein
MNSIIDSLDRIKAWLCTNYSESEVNNEIPPGMDEVNISQALSSLPFQVPNEVSILYRWSAGYDEDPFFDWIFFFYFKSLCSIKRARELRSILEEERDAYGVIIEYFGKPLFPIFEFNYSNYLAVIGDFCEKESSLIFDISEVRALIIVFSSLSDMFLTLAEAYENGALYRDPNGRIEEDTVKFSSIYRKYNSGILEYIFDDLQESYTLLPQNLNILSNKLDNCLEQIAWLKRYWEDIETIVKSSEKFPMIVNLSIHEDDSVASRAKGLLNYLDYDL